MLFISRVVSFFVFFSSVVRLVIPFGVNAAAAATTHQTATHIQTRRVEISSIGVCVCVCVLRQWYKIRLNTQNAAINTIANDTQMDVFHFLCDFEAHLFSVQLIN